jgi:hypothetical protein
MLTRAIRKSMQRQEGQALVIGALAVLILCIAVLTTVNLGHTVNERVRLQNTTDAAAYSMAAMEARAFNFYSFANRTQVSHYVSAMLWQSLLSFTYWAEAFLVDVYGVMKTLNVCAGSPSFPWSILCNTVIPLIPYLGAVIRVLTTIMNLYRTFLANVVLPIIRRFDPDKFVGRFVIPAYRVMNELLAAGSVATLASTMNHVRSASQDIIVANDPNITAFAQKNLGGFLSACILDRAHMAEANGSFVRPRDPFRPLDVKAIADTDKIARAKRVMGAVSNATRFACDNPGSNCGPGWVTSRKPLDLIQLPGSLGVVKDLLSMLPDWKWGQTKMLSYGLSRGYRARSANDGRGGNFIRGWKDPPGAPQGMLAQGDAMGSDDLYQIKLGPASIGPLKNPLSCSDSDDPNKCWGDPAKGRWDNGGRDEPFRAMMETSIWAMSDDEQRGGIHWRLVYPSGGSFYPSTATWNDRPLKYPYPNNFEARIGLSQAKRTIALFVSVDVWVANTRMIFDGNHPWQGLAAFPNFEPGQYASACPGFGSPDDNQAATRADTPGGLQEDFNQPSSFVILNKTAPEMDNPGDPTGAGNVKPAMLNTQKALTFEFQAPSKMVFDDTRMSFLGGKGLNTVTRAQAYYHRPGNWHEQPNFFNPYWRPRLASVWQGYTQFPLAQQIRSVLPGPARNQVQRFITH